MAIKYIRPMMDELKRRDIDSMIGGEFDTEKCQVPVLVDS